MRIERQVLLFLHGKRLSIDTLINGDHGSERWTPALSNEWGRLAQRNDTGVEATDTIEIIKFPQVPVNRKITYATFVCNHRPLKDVNLRICLVIGGDKLTYAFGTTGINEGSIKIISTRHSIEIQCTIFGAPRIHFYKK